MLPRSLTRKPTFLTLSLLVLMALVAVPMPWADASLMDGHSRLDAVPDTGSPGRSDPPTPATLDDSFGELPLYIVENRGQVDARVAYYVLGGTTEVYFSADLVTFALMEPDAAPPQRWAVKLDFVGANPHARPVGEKQAQAVVSYFNGRPGQWHTGLPTYVQVVYRDLWPGIDLAYYGQAGHLKYDFLVHPGADPAQIRLRYRGAESASLNAAGQLEVTTPLGGFVDDAPMAWQEINGRRAAIPVAYDLRDSDPVSTFPADDAELRQYPAFSFSFALGAYDRSQPLVIDPIVLLYCGYIGGSGYDRGYGGIAVDGAGNAYVTGETGSTEDSFPVAAGPDLSFNGGDYDAFVAKVSASGAGLVYAGYIGGSSPDVGIGISVDGDGNAYVAGSTGSDQATFPVAVGPDLTFNGGNDAFVAKVSASGTALVYAGYIGGLSYERGSGIATDSAGNAYVTGQTGSDQVSFPVTGGPDLTYNGGVDAFVAKVDASGAALVYAGYVGGSGYDRGTGIAMDGAGNAYVTGGTASTQDSFPVTGGPDLTYNGGGDAFIARVSASGTALVYAGYIGGSGWDIGSGIAVDGVGNAYVTGFTGSVEVPFPVTGGPDLSYNGGGDAFVAKVSASGITMVYAGYIGGSSQDWGYGIAVDGAGDAYVTGWTGSAQDSFPVTGGPDLTYNEGIDAFVARVSASGEALVYAGYIGGSGLDRGNAIAVDGAGDAYITGWTTSTQYSFPVTGGPDLTYNGGDGDVFVAKVGLARLDKRIYLPMLLRGN